MKPKQKICELCSDTHHSTYDHKMYKTIFGDGPAQKINEWVQPFSP